MNCLFYVLVFAFLQTLLCFHTYIPPTQIHMAYTGDPTEMRFAWHTTIPSGISVVNITDPETELITFYNGTSDTYLLSAGWNHNVKVIGLKPNKQYQFRVGSYEFGWSAQSEFTTAPDSSSYKSNWKFSHIGDMGIFEYSFETIQGLTRLVDSGDIDFVFQTGDFGYGNDRDPAFYEESWNIFFSQCQLIMNRVPYMVTVGNHEHSCGHDEFNECEFYATNFTDYNARYRMPGYESGSNNRNMWYSFDYNNVHFVIISTETDYPGAPYTEKWGDQLTWLETDLMTANSKNYDWIIVGGHRPMYVSVNGKSDPITGEPISQQASIQAAFEELFNKYNVDVYFDGHVHQYERSYPVYNSTVQGVNTQSEYKNPNATVYIVNGNAGNTEGFYTDWNTPAPSWSANRLFPIMEHGYGIVEIKGNTEFKWSYYINSNQTAPYDSFTITRG